MQKERVFCIKKRYFYADEYFYIEGISKNLFFSDFSRMPTNFNS